jgi:protein-L-isoaspartate(D-aspartate) O-methyltransferase
MTIHAPVPDFKAARASMVDTQLRPLGVSFPPLVEALASVEREQFVADAARPLAYIDRSVPMGDNRMMSSASVPGLLLTEMTPNSGEKAMVVGCGTGYSAALLAAMGLEVLGLECSAELAARARKLGIPVVEGPLEEGWKKGAPFDLILIDGAVEHIPEAIVAQLAEGGRLGAVLADRSITRLVIGRRVGKGFGLRSIADYGAAALPGFAKPASFSF